MIKMVFLTALLVGVGLQGCAPTARTAGEAGDACEEVGAWIEPKSGKRYVADSLITSLAAKDVVLLGESHPEVEHHRWQLSTIAALYGHEPNLVLGFESFPRSVQPALDRWVAGELDEAAFLAAVGWSKNWGFDSDLYMPIFHFARLHRIKMIALNLDRELISRIGDEGLKGLAPAERAGLSEPAPASKAYLESLAEVYGQHAGGEDDGKTAAIADDPRFKRFTTIQLAWDRVMADAIASARNGEDPPLVVGVIGTGHLEYRHGVPHQLADLGTTNVAVLLPMAPGTGCEEVPADLADAVFIVPPGSNADSAPRPRLGVLIEPAEDGVTVTEVGEDSVAAAAGLKAGDVILEAADLPLEESGGLGAVVERQAPGTWLPLVVKRGDQTLEVVAKFPAHPFVDVK